jgi:hypothetical protein
MQYSGKLSFSSSISSSSSVVSSVHWGSRLLPSLPSPTGVTRLLSAAAGLFVRGRSVVDVVVAAAVAVFVPLDFLRAWWFDELRLWPWWPVTADVSLV